MTYKILKSSIAAAKISDFAAAVAHHVRNLLEWRTREDIVAKQEPLPAQPRWDDFLNEAEPGKAFLVANQKYQIAKRNHYTPFPRPTAHPYIEAAVREDAGKFVADFAIVNDDPTDDQVLRARKNALLIKIGEAESAATQLVLGPPGKRRLCEFKTRDILQTKTKLRTPADVQHLADQASRQTKIDAIARAAAQAMSAVEDLTLDNVDDYPEPSL
jgi:hypothetical protein